jgi:hypothetical protein
VPPDVDNVKVVGDVVHPGGGGGGGGGVVVPPVTVMLPLHVTRIEPLGLTDIVPYVHSVAVVLPKPEHAPAISSFARSLAGSSPRAM